MLTTRLVRPRRDTVPTTDGGQTTSAARPTAPTNSTTTAPEQTELTDLFPKTASQATTLTEHTTKHTTEHTTEHIAESTTDSTIDLIKTEPQPIPCPVYTTAPQAGPSQSAWTRSDLPRRPNPFVLILAHKNVSIWGSHLHRALLRYATLEYGPNAQTASPTLGPRDSRPDAVLIVDAEIVLDQGIADTLAYYALNGGRVVFAWNFVITDSMAVDAPNFFERFGCNWRFDGRGPAALVRNALVNEEIGGYASLVLTNATWLINVPIRSALYLTSGTSRDVRLCRELGNGGRVSTPIAWQQVGRGFLGFVGDLTADRACAGLVMEMLGFDVNYHEAE